MTGCEQIQPLRGIACSTPTMKRLNLFFRENSSAYLVKNEKMETTDRWFSHDKRNLPGSTPVCCFHSWVL